MSYKKRIESEIKSLKESINTSLKSADMSSSARNHRREMKYAIYILDSILR